MALLKILCDSQNVREQVYDKLIEMDFTYCEEDYEDQTHRYADLYSKVGFIQHNKIREYINAIQVLQLDCVVVNMT